MIVFVLGIIKTKDRDMKVIRKHFDKKAFQEACEEKLRREYGIDAYGRINMPIGMAGRISLEDIVERVKKEVGEENFTKTEEYKLIHVQVNWSNNYSVWLVVSDMNGGNIQLISVEDCQIIEDEKV